MSRIHEESLRLSECMDSAPATQTQDRVWYENGLGISMRTQVREFEGLRLREINILVAGDAQRFHKKLTLGGAEFDADAAIAHMASNALGQTDYDENPLGFLLMAESGTTPTKRMDEVVDDDEPLCPWTLCPLTLSSVHKAAQARTQRPLCSPTGWEWVQSR